MIEQLPELQQKYLAEYYPDHRESSHASGGHMAYHRFLLSDPASIEPLFIKSHDSSLVEEDWRRDEMRYFLHKEARVYDHLRSQNYPMVPEFAEINEDMLILSGFHKSLGWHWRAPKDESDFKVYTADVLDALEELEAIAPHDVTEQDEISLDVFYNSGWDLLHDIDIRGLVTHNLARWEGILYPETTPAALKLARAAGDLAIKRADIHPLAYNHHDARQANIAWHPEHGVKIVDWSWADKGLSGGDKTMFLLDLHKSGYDITPFIAEINVDYAKLVIGYWLARSQTEHMEGNDNVRMHQFISAVKASELLLDLT